MRTISKLNKLIETINTYYAFALIVYAAALYITSHSQFFFWIFIIATPVLTGWGGYLLRSYLMRRNQRHGFRIISDVMSYEINGNHKYTLRYATTIKAANDHLMVYPIGYRWTGSGVEAIPKLNGKGQQLLTPLQPRHKGSAIKIAPYEAPTVSTEGDWHYWFIALNPPVHKGEVVEIKYTQEFQDKKGMARPYLYYFVRTPMKQLELNVKFPANALPTSISSSYIKPSDPNRPYLKPGVEYDPDKQWATWVIERPKKGYCYRIHWQ